MSPYSNLSFIFTPVYSLQWRGSKPLYAANAAVMPYTLQQRQTLPTPMSDVSSFGVEIFSNYRFWAIKLLSAYMGRKRGKNARMFCAFSLKASRVLFSPMVVPTKGAPRDPYA